MTSTALSAASALVVSRTAARLLAVLALSAAAMLSGGCATTSAPAGPRLSLARDLSTILREAPAPMLVAKGHECSAALKVANAIPGSDTMWGVGESMEPLYASHTALVVSPREFGELRTGMLVVYRNRRGTGVSHVLVARQESGWVVQGVNNNEPDDDLVTSRNLLGVVTHAFAATTTAARAELSGEIVAGLGRAESAGNVLAYQSAGQ